MSRKLEVDEPNMSDTGLLVTVEDLINQAMGPPDGNAVNFKVMQAVLHILARQQRILEQRVQIKLAEMSPPRHKLKKQSQMMDESSESSTSPSPKGRMANIKEEREPRGRNRAQREKERAEKLTQKAREKEERAASREQSKAQKATLKEREKAERATSKERERAEKAQSKVERAASKERDKAEKAALKEVEKSEKAQSKSERTAFKDKEREERAASKERERAEKAQSKAERAVSKEREKEERATSKERDKAERAASKERDKAERAASKERDKAERAASKERDKAERAASKEREKEERTASKEREKEQRAASKEREKEERTASKEREKEQRAALKEREKEERTASKEREKEQRAASKEREKEERTASKEREKEQRAASKEREKEQRAALKEREKEERTASKEREKEQRAASKEREKEEKAALKEKEKADKLSQKEEEKAEKAEKAAQKDKERAEKERIKSSKQERKSSATAVSVREVKREKENILVVEKGPTTWSDAQARGSIEVVTQSQFALLEAAVRELRDMAVPQPLAMPDNAQLRSDLAKGQATLPDTMQAMQIDARVKAAEMAIGRMTGLLTQLAAAGDLPEELELQMEEIQAERAAAEIQAQELRARPSLARKSVIIAPTAKLSEASGRPSMAPRPSAAPTPRPSVAIMKQPSSRTSTATVGQGVSQDEMDDALHSLREELIKSMNTMTARAGATADNALHTAKSTAEKMEVAKTLDLRLSTLHSLALDYADQLNGFDAGLSTQMQSFREQMVQMRSDLQGGLTLLEAVNNNAETAAVVELTARYQELVTELEATLHSHRALTKLQSTLTEELRSLVECVELLREQKADRDEVADGLRDKADTSRLAGLLTESEFAMARTDLERRLAVCHDKFQRQDSVWMTAIKDLNRIMDSKAEIIDLLSCRDEVQKQLQLLHERLQVLAAVLGEPKAAAVKRQLAAGATCAACGVPALMSPRDASRGAPPRLPALRPPPAGDPNPNSPCFKDLLPPELPDDRHVCRRWCGGSHTLVTESTRHEQATSLPTDAAPTKRYTGYGTDGRLYMMEEEMQPCVECNQIGREKCEVPPLDLAAGDQQTQRGTVVNIHLNG